MPGKDYYLPQRGLVSQQDSAITERSTVPRSRFMNRWSRLTTFHSTYLYPFLLDEVLPGDHLTYNITPYVRMATPLFPMFSNMRVDTFVFFVPMRLLWTNFERFMGSQDSPGDDVDGITIPQLVSPASGFAINSLMDHFGIPVVGQIAGGLTISVNALPFRAYNMIWNDWFRDQNLSAKKTVSLGDGPDNVADYLLAARAKSHDYFTSALPWTQKQTAPTVPIGGLAPVIGLGAVDGTGTASGGSFRESTHTTAVYAYVKSLWDGAAGNQVQMSVDAAADAYPLVFANLDQATGMTINVFRQAYLIQTMLERDARGGTRYIEKVWNHFGVRNPDFRLNRPEYIGGGQSPMNITPIAQTAPTTGVPLGALGGAATSVGHHRASYAATEHGYIIGMINVRSELAYQQGLHKIWSRLVQTDFYVPSLAGLGEQAILSREIFCDGNAADATAFGYQERWHELRTRYSDVAGLFRSTTAGNIDEWHTVQQFSPRPTLNSTFINDTPPLTRVLAAGSAADNQQFIGDILIERNAVRPIPAFGTPVTLGRF